VSRLCFTIACWLPFAAMLGCAATPPSAPPIACESPESWRGRLPYEGVNPIRLYATNVAAAKEMNETLQSIAQRFVYFRSKPVTTGEHQALVIVVDMDDDSLVQDERVAFEIFVRGYAEMSGFPRPSQRQLEETRKRFARLGAPANSLLVHLFDAMPWVITREDAAQHVGVPATPIQDAAWIARYPTDARIRAAVKAMVPKLLDHAEKTGDLTATGRVMVNPFKGLIRSQLAAELIEQRDRSFEQITRQRDPTWIAVRDARRDSMKDWRVLASANATAEQINDVLGRAAAARKLAPDDLQVMRVQAAALYRAGKYEVALTTYDEIQAALARRRQTARANGLGNLAQSLMPNIGGTLQRNIENATRLQPVDMAFRAMAYAQLGQHDNASESIEALNTQVKGAGPQPMGAKAIYAEARRVVKMLKAHADE